jgi:acyl carrier protein
MNLVQQLLQFVREELASGADPTTIDENTPLIDGGLIDSMGLMRLIVFIEERGGVRVPDSEVLPDNFQTVADIDNLIRRLTAR